MYAYFDGDGIGDSIELLLLNGNLKEAKTLSAQLNKAIFQLKQELTEKLNGEIILFGGDDLFLYYNYIKNDINIIKIARENYFRCSDHFISCGCGETLHISMENLRKAKLMGKNHFIYNNQIIL